MPTSPVLIKLVICIWAGWLLSGCATPVQTQQLRLSPPSIPAAHNISQVPFFPQADFYCGPTTLAEVLNYYGMTLTPEQIAPEVFIPGLEGSLQIEMAAAARSKGLLAYVEKGDISQLLELVSDDIPIIILQNLSISWFPSWHYALVKGYDLNREEVIMHSGPYQDYRTDFELLERTWQRGKFWLLAIVPPNRTSPHFNQFIYTRTAQELIETQNETAGIRALISATTQWPDYWLPYFLLGNYFLDTDLSKAISWYQKGLSYAEDKASYLNNYAFALLRSNCIEQAREHIEHARRLAPNDGNIAKSYQTIFSQTQNKNDCTLSF